MRNLKLQVQISVDGFIATELGATDWLVWDWGEIWPWDDELKRDFDAIIDSVDCVLLSSRLAEGGFIAHWETAAEDPRDPRFAYAQKLNAKRKVVFSTTATESRWSGTELARGDDLVAEVMRLKDQEGRDMIVYGGAAFVSALVEADLIDEYQLFVNPTVLGRGLPIFTERLDALDLLMLGSRSYECGIVVVRYAPRNGLRADAAVGATGLAGRNTDLKIGARSGSSHRSSSRLLQD
jgi:dihydrofolate reductase